MPLIMIRHHPKIFLRLLQLILIRVTIICLVTTLAIWADIGFTKAVLPFSIFIGSLLLAILSGYLSKILH